MSSLPDQGHLPLGQASGSSRYLLRHAIDDDPSEEEMI